MARGALLPPGAGLLPDGAKLGGWWRETEESGRILCELCPRACHLKPGDKGFCFVRENRDGQMALTTYGRSTGFCIDPIEKKPLNHFYPGTSVLSFGTAGCNLGCKFCQNHDISKARKVELLSEAATPETIANAALRLGCKSVAYTYNDPVIWAEYAIDTAKACRRVGVKSVAVTAGYITPEARPAFFEYFDAANVDLKAFTEEFYQHLTLSHLAPVLETLEWLKRETDVWFEITNLIIPRANDTPEEFRRMCDWVLDHIGDDTPVHFTAFHPDFKLTDRPATPVETLLAAHEVARECGLKYAYVGNVHDDRRQSTYCPSCGKLLIQRDWYTLGAYALEGNCCAGCGQEIPGRFDSKPGDWGAKRQPVRIAQFAAVVNPQNDASRESAASTAPSQGDLPMNQTTTATSTPAADQLPELDERQRVLVHAAASRIVAAAVRGETARLDDLRTNAAAQTLVLGAYVSLKRQGRLRGCCGFLGTPAPLQEALTHAALRTATEDPRLPRVSPSELAFLDLEVWLLANMRPMRECGEARKNAIEIGRHGLQIARGQARGLLLPGVATDHQLDAEGFLEQVSIKAGLPPTAWKEDDTQLFTFEGLALGGPFAPEAIDKHAPHAPLLTKDEFAALTQFCRDNIRLIMQRALPNYYLPNCRDGMVNGVAIHLQGPQQARPLQLSKVSFRPGMPMQSSIYSLTEAAAQTLEAQGVAWGQLGQIKIDLTILDDTAMHGTVANADLQGLAPESRAVMVVERGRSAWRFDPRSEAEALLAATAADAQVRFPHEAAVYSLRAHSSVAPAGMAHVPAPQRGADVRPAAVAGRFYPADAEARAQEVDRLFAGTASEAKPCQAVMVPHAGLVYSGKIAAQVFAEAEIPETVIVIGPKHTSRGVDWAVAPHRVWSFPGGQMASDPELAKALVEAIPNLELDAAAHESEHGIEVQLPLFSATCAERPRGGRGDWPQRPNELPAICSGAGQGAANQK